MHYETVWCILLLSILMLTSCNSSETVKEHYDTGELKYEYSVRNGKREGKYKMYNKDGTIRRDGQYSEGVLAGWNNFYCGGGRVCVKSHYESQQGEQRLTQRIHFDENGVITADLKFAIMDISIHEVDNNDELNVNDTLSLELKINNSDREICTATLGEFDEDFMEVAGNTYFSSYDDKSKHEMEIQFIPTRAGLDTLTIIVRDFDQIHNADSTSSTLVGEINIVRHIINVRPSRSN